MGLIDGLKHAAQRLPILGGGDAPRPPAKPATQAPVDTFEAAATGQGGVVINPGPPGTRSAGATVSAEGSAGEVGVEGEVTVDANVDSEVTHEGGYTTVTISANASVDASGSLSIKAVSIGGGVSAGGNVTYTVRMSDADYERMKRGELPPPNPSDPSTIPDGASVRLDQSQFVGTSLEVGLDLDGVELGIGESGKDTKGTSVLIARHGDTLQVTAGPTEVLEKGVSVSLGYGPAKLEVGNTTTLGDYQMATAEFDLGSPEGQAAYQQFSQTGQVPTQPAPGVLNPVKVEHVTFSSTTEAEAKLGPLSVGLSSQTNTGDLVVTTYPDGRKESTGQARYGDGAVLSVTQSYDANGNPDPAGTRYQLTYDTTDPATRMQLYEAFTGQVPPDSVINGTEPLVVTFTPEQLLALQSEAKASSDPANPVVSGLAGTAEDPLLIARSLAALSGSTSQGYEASALDGWFFSDGQRLPGQLSVGGEPVP